MDQFSFTRRSSLPNTSTKILSPLPVKKRGSIIGTPKVSKPVVVNFNDDEDDKDDHKPSQFFSEKIRQLTSDYQDDYFSYDSGVETASNRSFSVEDSADERRAIMESFESSAKDDWKPISRAENPLPLDNTFLRGYRTIQLSSFARCAHKATFNCSKFAQ